MPVPGWLLILHRYLGVAVGLLMLVWCLSGVVMMFVRYPELPEARRVRGLEPIRWSACCMFRASVSGTTPIRSATVEALAGSPVVRMRTADGNALTLDLADGRPIEGVGPAEATEVAQAFAGPRGRPAPPRTVDLDQWTVSGEFRPDRPLYKVALGDPAGSELYVSSRTGEAVQLTTASGRFWNWLGAVPHWLYPTLLRQDAGLWSQVVIWTSLVGCFLTVTGLYLGLAALRRSAGRWSPYRRVWLWHHLAGVGFGVLTLAWVASGLVSMNPLGFLESPPDDARARLEGAAPSWGQVQGALQRLARSSPPGMVSVSTAPLGGRLYLLARTAKGEELRLDANGSPAPMDAGKLADAAHRLASSRPIASQGVITAEDAYYFRHHEPVLAPVYRVILQDGTRYYLDAGTARLVRVADGAAQGYRWLHQGLHRWDVIPGLHDGPVWAILMIAALAGVTTGVGTGVYLGLKAVLRDVRRLSRGRARAP